MANLGPTTELTDTLAVVRGRIDKYSNSRNFNEQNTKASLIIPVLQALGWDTNDSEEVHWEYKPKPKYNPVDFALLLRRTPCLFLEAKALRENLDDDKLTAQVLTYASVAGIQWVALSNGDEYRIYNATALLPVDEKLFRRVRISQDDDAIVADTLSLLSKANLDDSKIGRLWEAHFVDRQVKLGVEDLLSPEKPASSIVRAIKKLSQNKLLDSQIRASLQRMRISLDFPPPDPAVATTTATRKKEGRRGKTGRDLAAAQEVQGVSLVALIKEGILKVPAKVFCEYRGQALEATIREDGSVIYSGVEYSSLSTAAGVARKPFHEGDLKGRSYPQTNGWIFWHVRDHATQEDVPLDRLRQRYAQKKKAEVQKFTDKGA